MKKASHDLLWHSTQGYLYAVRGIGFDAIKIGYTSGHVETRIKAVQGTLPFAIDWLGYCRGTPIDEREIHELLSDSLLRADWFRPTDAVVSLVRSRLVLPPTIRAEQSKTSHRMRWRRVENVREAAQ